jgi:threonine dehydratase
VHCGESNAPEIPSRVISIGRVHDGWPTGFAASIGDRPGSLARVCRVIADFGVSINRIAHDRSYSGPDVSAVHAFSKVAARD